jgi:pimeloyl-ACP methyl ester carboxylesterase
MTTATLFSLISLIMVMFSGCVLSTSETSVRWHDVDITHQRPDTHNELIDIAKVYVPFADHGAPITTHHFSPVGTVVICPGFLRSHHPWHDLASALTNRGWQVVIADIAWSMIPTRQRWFLKATQLHHRVAELEQERTIYIGHSAGGVIALLAARYDRKARGVILLDFVDAQHRGFQAAQQLTIPLWGIMGAPSHCNDWHRGYAALATIAKIHWYHREQVGHCDFESPSTLFCTFWCGRTQLHHQQQLITDILNIVSMSTTDATKMHNQ